jgi:hypothetical protein
MEERHSVASRIMRYFPIPAILLLCAPLALPQQDAASLSGLITDPQGRRVASARVEVERTATGQRTQAESSADGSYRFPALAPGSYHLRVTATGFQTAERSPVILQVRYPRQLDIELKLEQVGQQVAVSANGLSVNSSDATLGNNFNGEQITQLPLEGRNVLALLSLQPGAVYTNDTNIITRTNFGEADADARNGAINGGRSDQANVTLDGVDVNDQQTGFAFNSALRINTEAVQEFRVITAGAGSDLGRSSGAQVALVTRGGSNAFHGTLFHSHRNTATSANNFFNNRAGLGRAKLIRNTFGGALGGPLVRNKLFFFGSYEGRRDASEATLLRNVPTQQLRDGFVRYRNRAGALVTLTPDQVRQIDPRGSGANPGTIALMRQYPLPNDTPNIDPLNFGGFRFNSPLADRLNAGTVRFDAAAFRNQQLFLRGNLQSDSGLTALQFPGTPPPFQNRNTSKGFAVGHNWAINATLWNSFRYGYARNKIEEIGTTTNPLFSFGGGVAAPIPLTYSRGRIAPAHNIVNDISWNRGRHTLQAGANVRFLGNSRYNVEPNRALYVTQVSRLANRGAEVLPADIASPNDDFVRAFIMITGSVSQGNTPVNYDQNGNIIPAGTPLRRRFVTNEYEWYVQDSWRLRPNLTVTAGLRHSLYSPLREAAGLAVRTTVPVGDWFELRRQAADAGRPSNSVSPIAYELSKNKGNPGFYDWDRNNFAPRLSAAWSPASGWAVRGSFGMFHDRVGSASAALYDSLGSFGLNSTQINPAGVLTVATAPRFESLAASYPSLAVAPPPFRFPLEYPRGTGAVGAIIPAPDTSLTTPYSMLSTISVQKEFAGSWLLEAAYVNRTSRDLLGLFDSAAPLNLRDPQSGLRYFEAVNQLTSQGNVAIGSVRGSAYWDNLFPALATTAQNLTRIFPAFTRLNPGVAPETMLSPSQTAYALFQQANPGNPLAALRSIDVSCAPGCSRFGRYALYNDQFASLFSWRSLAPASYNAMQVSLRRRMGDSLTLDANYTMSRSRDWTSGVERGDAFSGSFLINSWEPSQMESFSDFDLRHQFNMNWVAQLPFGKGRRFASSGSSWANAIVGGWQLAGVFRMSSGFPITVQNGTGNPTNHYFRGFGLLQGNAPETETNKNGPQGPNLFVNPAAAAAAYIAPAAGQTGNRNSVRGDGVFSLDFGLGKQFALPGRDGHHIALRWEVFNATNTVRFDVRSANLTVGQAGFGTLTSQLGGPRVMQFLLRYAF